MREIIEIIQLSQSQDWKGVSDTVEIAKGRNKFKRTFKDVCKYFTREMKLVWQKK